MPPMPKSPLTWLAAWWLASSTQLVFVSHALVTRNKPVQRYSFLNIDQVPGPLPLYVSYGPPDITTFSNLTTACWACQEFFPVIKDGKRLHADLHEDKNGGIWEQSCRAGPCDFRDPQTQGYGGVAGQGVGPGNTPDGKTCITLDPVPWFNECEPITLGDTSSMLDVTRYCSYKQQIFIPPPAQTVSRFARKPKAWSLIGRKDQCMETIAKQGSALFDEMSFCDSDMQALSGCCESVYGALTCVAETATAKGVGNQTAIFASMAEEGALMLDIFSKYCVPLCQNTKEEFCGKFPEADVCVSRKSCESCTATGGIWCPKLKSCHCPGPKPPCIKPPIRVPLKCLPEEEEKKKASPILEKAKPKKIAAAPAAAAPESGPDAASNALCKYAQMASKWGK